MMHHTAQAIGLDLGGTKIEAQVFDVDWQSIETRRVATPDNYENLIRSLADLITGIETDYRSDLPVGIGAAGIIHPETGRAVTANLNANGRTLPADISAAVGRAVTYLNDSRAMTLSEAVFGAGKAHNCVACVILGTGVGGGVAINGCLQYGPTHTGGEFGHTSASAAIVQRYGLPVVACGCGRYGCIETYLSGPGLERIAATLTSKTMSARDISDQRRGDTAAVWDVWCALGGDFLRNLILTIDPDVIVLGGGLSNIDGIVPDLQKAAKNAQIGDFTVPPIVVAQAGDTSGARGAAFAAWQAAQ